MPNPTPVIQNQQVITMEDLYRQKGEVVTQLEIAQAKLQMINSQIQQIFNAQQQQVLSPK